MAEKIIRILIANLRKITGLKPEECKDNTFVGKDPEVLYEVDKFFNKTYNQGLALSGTVDRERRRERFYNLIQYLRSVADKDGIVVECGCWRGLSSYIICNTMKLDDPDFDGSTFRIFDSFEGLSEPKQKDRIGYSILVKGRDRKGTAFKSAGAYAADINDVKQVLHEYPAIEFFKGWLPESLKLASERKYKFVHIDVDLYDPIKGSLHYFIPRMVQGGVILCDDYGSLVWPGAKMAVDEAAEENGYKVIPLSTGQAVIVVG